MSPTRRRNIADIASIAVAVLVLVVCGVGIVATHRGDIFATPPTLTDQQRTQTTTTTSPRTVETKDTVNTVATGGTAAAVPSDQNVTTTTDASTSIKTVVSPVSEDTSLVGRAFASPIALILFEVLLGLLAAFLAAAATQRVVLGSYGLKIGGLEIDPIAPVTTADAEAVDVITVGEVENLVEGAAPRLPNWAKLPPELTGEYWQQILHRVLILEIALRRAAAVRNISSDDLVFVAKRLVPAPPAPADTGDALVDLLGLSARIQKGATVEKKARKTLLARYEEALLLIAPMAP